MNKNIKENLDKGISTPLGLGIVVAVAVVVGVIVWYVAQIRVPIAEPMPTPTPTSSPTPTLTPTSTPTLQELYIEIVSPNGGEQWIIGETHDIRWHCGFGEGSNFDIYVVNESENRTLIGSMVSCPLERYTWKVGDDWDNKEKVFGGKYKIEFRAVAGSSILHDASDGYFSIID
jgi:hypothetical protein